MLLRGSNTRGARGQPQNRARASRGRGTASRGAPTSSISKPSEASTPSLKNIFSIFSNTGTTSNENLPNTFEKERLDNAAKRELRAGHTRGMTHVRGSRANMRGNNQVRFSDSQTVDKNTQSSGQAATTSSPFGAPSTAPFNPFAPAQNNSASGKAFSAAPKLHNPFETPAQPPAAIFGTVQGTALKTSPTNGLQNTPSSIFGAPSTPFSSSPFGAASSNSNGTQKKSERFVTSSHEHAANSFGGQSNGTFSSIGAPSNIPRLAKSPGTLAPTTRAVDAFVPNTSANAFSNTNKPDSSLISEPTSSTVLASKMEKLLQKEGISQPVWPTTTPGDPQQKAAVESFWQTFKTYRSKVRVSLIRAGLLDDPDKPKKLSEAIDFKGTCEDMCPEFEKITRIMEHDVRDPEKEIAPDGSLRPSPQRMVKALARSAAGQDAPLPMDVRSPAALRRTLDYLLHTILGDDTDLSSVHGFLWDRTRAIRRDFVFQSSMNALELGDQVYCLERITRFHVIALHQMSKEDVVAEDFSEQQEVEQLGKALLSLIHAYEDCSAQGIICDNEAEFRAYYVVFNSHNTGILETVQDWGWKFWGESAEIRTAVCLVEALQNIWDSLGPLRPQSATDLAQNAYGRFFSIVGDRQVSYTMACFAEIHFNNVRKSALKAILASYRKQRDQTKDWTLAKLNTYLWFDDEEDIISFGEAYGLQFDESNGEVHLSFDSGDGVSDPFPPLKQRHSYSLVERKRGDNSLPAVIDKTVFEDEGTAEHFRSPDKYNQNDTEKPNEEPELFVKDGGPANGLNSTIFSVPSTLSAPNSPSTIKKASAPTQFLDTTSTNERKPAPAPTSSSLFDRVSTPHQLRSDFASQTASEKPLSGLPGAAPSPTPPVAKSAEKVSSFSLQPTFPPPGETANPNSKLPSLFSPQPSSVKSPTPSIFQGASTTPARSTPTSTAPPQFSSGDSAITSSNTPALSSFGALNQVSSSNGASSKTKQAAFPSFAHSAVPGPISGAHPSAGTGQIQTDISKLAAAPASPSPITYPDNKISRALSVSTPKEPEVIDKQQKFSNFCNWFANGEHGLVDQFTAFTIEGIVKRATKVFMKAEAERIAREADALAKEEADQFRLRSLASKYGRMWREAAHRKWLRRRGREARKARQEMAESLRASKTAQSASIIEDFRASTSNRRNSLESLLNATGVLNGVHDSTVQIRAIVQDDIKKAGSLVRRRSERSNYSPSSTTTKSKLGSSANRLRRSLLSDPSYLNGGSRIHLMSRYSAEDEDRRQVSGVKTDYFRLKARGVTTLPNGTPLATSVAHGTLHKKRSFDSSRPATPDVSRQLPIPRSAPTVNRYHPRPHTSIPREGNVEPLEDRDAALIEGGENSRHKERKRTLDDEGDEELFARAKRIREQMDEGVQWFRREIERSRSVSEARGEI